MELLADRRCPSNTVAVIMVLNLVSVGAPHQVSAQVPISAPAVSLSRPLSVRSAGLNGAGGALVGNAGAVFSNPAGIATIRHVGLESSYRSTPSGGSLASGAFAWRLRQFDLGLGFARYRFGDDPTTHPIPGIPVGSEAKEYAGVGSLVYRFGIIALAGSGKYVQRVVNDSRETTFSGDAGLAIAIFDIMAIGFSMQNIGGRWGGTQAGVTLPQLTRLAVMWNYVDPLETFRLLSTVEVQWPENEETRIVLGGEGGFVVGEIGLFARGGYSAKSTGPVHSRFTYGGSLTLSSLALDYAFQEAHGSANTHRFGFRLTI